VQQVINPKVKEVYPETNYQLRQAVGIDTSKLFVARTGIRGSNDLIWVGRAAKLRCKDVLPQRGRILNVYHRRSL